MQKKKKWMKILFATNDARVGTGVQYRGEELDKIDWFEEDFFLFSYSCISEKELWYIIYSIFRFYGLLLMGNPSLVDLIQSKNYEQKRNKLGLKS